MRFWNSPARNLLAGIAFVLAVTASAVAGYVHLGWPLGDAIYMVVLTIFTVGYGEVHPVETPALRAVTISLIVLGCTGMIFVTGALVQLITASSISQALGLRKMDNQIGRLENHVIICGFGRTGQMLARELQAGQARFLIIERSETRFAQARDAGYLAMQADATDETTLQRAGIAKARVLATVLPDDAMNVFITLSARSLNAALTIIARGEAPSTEMKLRHAGANQVVLSAQIGAERIAEMILYPSGRREGNVDPVQMEHDLRALGLHREVVVAAPGGFANLTVAQAELRGGHTFFVVGIERQDGTSVALVDPATEIAEGEGVVLVGRGGRNAILAEFG
jgi:voltage-gated potassium channel Kch